MTHIDRLEVFHFRLKYDMSLCKHIPFCLPCLFSLLFLNLLYIDLIQRHPFSILLHAPGVTFLQKKPKFEWVNICPCFNSKYLNRKNWILEKWNGKWMERVEQKGARQIFGERLSCHKCFKYNANVTQNQVTSSFYI